MPKCEHGLTSKECYVCASPKYAERAEKQEPHRLTSWGFCSVCKHDKIPGEGCARKDCPEAPAAQRQPLTDEEIDKTHETQVWDARRSYARAIEAKLKEKNT
jgi:hypothetical protein